MRSLGSITRAFRRTIPALGCALALGPAPPGEAPTPAPATLNEIRGPIRVIRNDGLALVLHDAYVTGDTPMAIPLREVRSTRRRELDPFRGVGVLAVGAVVAFGVYVFATILPIGGS